MSPRPFPTTWPSWPQPPADGTAAGSARRGTVDGRGRGPLPAGAGDRGPLAGGLGHADSLHGRDRAAGGGRSGLAARALQRTGHPVPPRAPRCRPDRSTAARPHAHGWRGLTFNTVAEQLRLILLNGAFTGTIIELRRSYTTDAEFVWRRTCQMTICIAVNCEEGVVLASDRMVSASYLDLEFDHPGIKIHPVLPTVTVLSAGDALVLHDILIEGAGFAGQMQQPMVDAIAEHVRQRFVSVRRELATQRLLEPRGLTFESFYQEGRIVALPPDMAVFLDSQIQQINLGISLIVAGIDRSGPHIHGIEDPGCSQCFDRIGYHAIGSGQRHALLTLINQGHHRATPLWETVGRVYTAKREAEKAPGVGSATDIWVITQEESRRLSNGELQNLSDWYQEQIKSRQLEPFQQTCGGPE